MSGITTITGNTANGIPANLKVRGKNILSIDTATALTGTVGITSIDNYSAGNQFAYLGNVSTSTGWKNFKNDSNNNLTAENGAVLFENCSAKGNGGAIYQSSGLSVEVKNARFKDCSSGGNGGAVYTPGTIGMIGATFENCQAINGGAVYSAGNLTIKQTGTGTSEIKNCSAFDTNGGAVQVASGKTMTFGGSVVIMIIKAKR